MKFNPVNKVNCQMKVTWYVEQSRSLGAARVWDSDSLLAGNQYHPSNESTSAKVKRTALFSLPSHPLKQAHESLLNLAAFITFLVSGLPMRSSRSSGQILLHWPLGMTRSLV